MEFSELIYFDKLLKATDPEIYEAISNEWMRQENQIELIASENFVSKAVLAAIGSVLTNKYAEGYPGKRYYGGCEFADQAEQLAIDRICKLFNCKFANVQPHSGAQANFSVFFALMSPGDTFLGMDLAMGGHLTHGCRVSVSGKWFNAIPYGVTKDGIIDYDEIRSLAKKHDPKLLVCGASAYPRKIDFKAIREIADEVEAYVMADVAHYAGLIVADCYPNPFPYAHVVTSTTHKTLRGPRGGVILTDDETLAKKINSAVFPGVQGGPHMHTIAGKAVAFGEALKPEFKDYAKQIVKNAKSMADRLQKNGLKLVSGGTESHMVIVDLSDLKSAPSAAQEALQITGKDAETWLEQAHITCNKNAIPFDPLPPVKTSGIRLGTPAMTTRGFNEDEFATVADLISSVLKADASGREAAIKEAAEIALKLCEAHPIYK